jgi:hypothetical protein
MRRLAAALAVSGLMAVAAGAEAETVVPSAVRCDRSLGALKTLSDPQRWLVNLRPRTTTVREINSLRRPRPTPTRRNNAFERQVWRVKAVIVKDRLEDDGDLQVVLFDRGAYMIAELPEPACLPRTTRARRALVRARRRFEQGCGAAARSWTNQGAVAYVSGVGFWDLPNGQSGHARNYAELHPVTGVTFLVGCDGEQRGGG